MTRVTIAVALALGTVLLGGAATAAPAADPTSLADGMKQINAAVALALTQEQQALRAIPLRGGKMLPTTKALAIAKINASLKALRSADGLAGTSGFGPLLPSLYAEEETDLDEAVVEDTNARRHLTLGRLVQARVALQEAIRAKRDFLGLFKPQLGACMFASSGDARPPFAGNAFHLFNCKSGLGFGGSGPVAALASITRVAFWSPVPITSVQGPIAGDVDANRRLTERAAGSCSQPKPTIVECTLTTPLQPSDQVPGIVFVDVFLGVPAGTVVEALIGLDRGFQVLSATAR